MAIGIKKVGQISQDHIPLSIREDSSEYENEQKRLYTKAEDASEKHLILYVAYDNFDWTFKVWKQPDLWAEVDVPAAEGEEVLFIKNIALLQHKYDLDSIEAPELCRNWVNEMPLYHYEDEECSDEELDAWLGEDGEE